MVECIGQLLSFVPCEPLEELCGNLDNLDVKQAPLAVFLQFL